MRLNLLVALGIATAGAGAGAAPAEPGPPGVAVFGAGMGGYSCFRIPALVALGDGKLLAFAEARKLSCSDHGWVDLVVRSSSDSGRSWGGIQRVVSESREGALVTDGNPAPVALRNGSVLLPYCRNNRQVFVVRSDDEGRTWTDPQNITDESTDPSWSWVATGPPGSIELPNGDVVVPSDHRGPSSQGSHTLRLDRASGRWRLQQLLDQGNECQAALLSNGSTLLGMRPRSKTTGRLFALSDDGGATFHPPTNQPALRDPECEGSLVAAPSGQLYLSNAASSTSRTNVTIHVSRDGAASWQVLSSPWSGPSAYSSLAVMQAGAQNRSIGLLWEAWPNDGPKYAAIHFTIATDTEH
ncbi:hypothetical protein FNF27_07632 [Cafeteria roenbergensis]|uniref:Sialidase domain-containing protein n=1 Tax=Cafeteria roenbergensis TaxID=33653 RepID=A0A5A8DLR7_CAFRO|nr:hypothetical protein FNF29_02959 [Cafeteria roenbergensis]KAA0165624.1 hypothetical protein FNF27_07632 [Cafeteria roenbergensis]|eukprot:KAA0153571.1 hypothetical protein FNF29_02959 [Cafeteria roenbergensis]